ncbi:MAG: hypothetical protein CMO21_07140, partial [Thioclava sp.]|nr:hypothetical protein [Thioclava sp.]
AAMFEEALAASQVLEREAMELGAAMGQFKLGAAASDEGAESTSPAERAAAATSSPETSGPRASAPNQSALPKSAQQVSMSGNTALAVPPPTDDDWEDF